MLVKIKHKHMIMIILFIVIIIISSSISSNVAFAHLSAECGTFGICDSVTNHGRYTDPSHTQVTSNDSSDFGCDKDYLTVRFSRPYNVSVRYYARGNDAFLCCRGEAEVDVYGGNGHRYMRYHVSGDSISGTRNFTFSPSNNDYAFIAKTCHGTAGCYAWIKATFTQVNHPPTLKVIRAL
ncbi:MAG: hypothetical protein ACOCQR_00290 [bacterium]